MWRIEDIHVEREREREREREIIKISLLFQEI
jgi:hypothetical protein